MIRDNFEMKIGATLRNAVAPVPEGSWDSIRSKIPKAGANSASSGAEISPAGGIVGIIVCAAILLTASLTSGPDTAVAPESKSASVPERVEPPVRSNAGTAAIPDPEPVADLNEEVQNTGPSETREVSPAVKVISTDHPEAQRPKAESDRSKTQAKPMPRTVPSEVSTAIAPDKEIRTGQQKNNTTERPAKTEKPAQLAPVAFAKIKASVNSGYAPLRVKFENTGNGSHLYWEFGTVAESRNASPEVIFEEPGTYQISLTVTDEAGNFSEDYSEIVVKEGSSFFIPNAFTPDGDGLNDTYKVSSARNIKSFYMVITDDRGNTIFQTRNVDEAWDPAKSAINPDKHYFVTYRAVGVDGKVYAAKLQALNILYR